MLNRSVQDNFIDAWGAMGSVWGISPSVARVHALLMVSDGPLCLDDLAERLQISKSNVSMSLKELRSWRVVHRSVLPGDRREFYASETDSWRMLVDILRERKKREFDPLLESVRTTIQQMGKQGRGPVPDRLKRMEKMLVTVDRIAERLIAQRNSVQMLAARVLGKL